MSLACLGRGGLRGVAPASPPRRGLARAPALPRPPAALRLSAPLRACRVVAAAAAALGAVGRSRGARLRQQLPNFLTLLRVLAIGPFVALFYAPGAWAPGACSAVFSVAALTDWLDGYLARRWHVSSAFGAFLDPVADKLMVGAALVLLPTAAGAAGAGSAALLALPAVVLTLREIFVSALREWMATLGRRDAVKVGWAGKCKTAGLMVSVAVLLATCRQGLASWAFKAALALLHFSALLAVTSGAAYFSAAWPALAEGWRAGAGSEGGGAEGGRGSGEAEGGGGSGGPEGS